MKYIKRIFAVFFAFGVALNSVHALILYNAGNDATNSAPSNGAPWDAVAYIGAAGTAVHIGNGYFLTANHVNGNSISFADNQNFSIDQSFGTNGFIKIGSADLKIFKIADETINEYAAVNLFEGVLSGGEEITLIGCGMGRDSADQLPTNGETSLVDWAHPKSMRWGLNEIFANSAVEDNLESQLNYQIYMTQLNTPSAGGLGDYEAGLASADSGSPMFFYYEDNWFLAGIATTTTRENASFFGGHADGDLNIFVNLGAYLQEIYAITGNIPETSEYAIFISLAALIFAIRKRKNKKFI